MQVQWNSFVASLEDFRIGAPNACEEIEGWMPQVDGIELEATDDCYRTWTGTDLVARGAAREGATLSFAEVQLDLGAAFISPSVEVLVPTDGAVSAGEQVAVALGSESDHRPRYVGYTADSELNILVGSDEFTYYEDGIFEFEMPAQLPLGPIDLGSDQRWRRDWRNTQIWVDHQFHSVLPLEW